MIRGLYQTRDLLLGACVRVDRSAGDAAPMLRPDMYEALGGTPPLGQLPSRDAYMARAHHLAMDPFELG